MGWRDGYKHHTKGGASRCGTVENRNKKPLTTEMAKKIAENGEKDVAGFSSRPPRVLFVISAVKGS
jgi:hypothetical protein